MPTTDIERDILRYADDAAFVAEADKPATDLATFTEHLAEAAERVIELDLVGAEEVRTAVALLADATDADPDERSVLVRRAERQLREGQDALEEYRLMV